MLLDENRKMAEFLLSDFQSLPVKENLLENMEKIFYEEDIISFFQVLAEELINVINLPTTGARKIKDINKKLCALNNLLAFSYRIRMEAESKGAE